MNLRLSFPDKFVNLCILFHQVLGEPDQEPELCVRPGQV